MPVGHDYTPLKPSPKPDDVTFIPLRDKLDDKTVYEAYPAFRTTEDTKYEEQKLTQQDVRIMSFPHVIRVVNGIVTPELRVLLSNVLSTVDASMPNKDQNKAVKHIIRKAFDEAYMEILREAYPDSNFAYGPEYTLSPEPNRGKAKMDSTMKSLDQAL